MVTYLKNIFFVIEQSIISFIYMITALNQQTKSHRVYSLIMSVSKIKASFAFFNTENRLVERAMQISKRLNLFA